MAQKLAKKLPNRCRNEKLKARRATSWLKNAKAKDIRKAEQLQQEKHNASVGCTGKMRYSNPNHSDNCTRGDHVSKNLLVP